MRGESEEGSERGDAPPSEGSAATLRAVPAMARARSVLVSILSVVDEVCESGRSRWAKGERDEEQEGAKAESRDGGERRRQVAVLRLGKAELRMQGEMSGARARSAATSRRPQPRRARSPSAGSRTPSRTLRPVGLRSLSSREAHRACPTSLEARGRALRTRAASRGTTRVARGRSRRVSPRGGRRSSSGVSRPRQSHPS